MVGPLGGQRVEVLEDRTNPALGELVGTRRGM